MMKTLAALAATALLAACVGPTPYRAAASDSKGTVFGYTSTKLSDQLYRVRFVSTSRTPDRWVSAFLLYRSAELAQEAGAPAFKVVEGKVDASVLSGDDLFGGVDGDAGAVLTTAVAYRTQGSVEVVAVDDLDLRSGMLRTAGPIYRPPPIYIPKPQPAGPAYIYTPTYIYPTPGLPQRSILVELRTTVADTDGQTFVTADVLKQLGPRIKRPAPPAA